MALLVDRHRPRSLKALTYHHDLSERLAALVGFLFLNHFYHCFLLFPLVFPLAVGHIYLREPKCDLGFNEMRHSHSYSPQFFILKKPPTQAQSGDFPHLLVYGPSGAGKKTRVMATLKELYGPAVDKIKIDARVFQPTAGSSARKLEFNIVASVYHLEITPADVGNYDRVVVQQLLKEVAQTQQVDAAARQRFKVVVVHEADALTRDAQAALRRTMEKYSASLRLVLLAQSTAGIIAPIRSRALLVRVPAPSEADVSAALRQAGAREGWPDAPALRARVARASGRNLRRALLMYETVHAQKWVTSFFPASFSFSRTFLFFFLFCLSQTPLLSISLFCSFYVLSITPRRSPCRKIIISRFPSRKKYNNARVYKKIFFSTRDDSLCLLGGDAYISG